MNRIREVRVHDWKEIAPPPADSAARWKPGRRDEVIEERSHARLEDAYKTAALRMPSAIHDAWPQPRPFKDWENCD